MKINLNPSTWFASKPTPKKRVRTLPTELPDSRVSKSEYEPSIDNFKDSFMKDFITPDVSLGFIPLIRRLSWFHPELSQVVDDIVKLVNTGYTIEFDKSVSPEQMDKMRKFIDEESSRWINNNNGLHGYINKLTAQILISGAISNEWVIKPDLTGIQTVNLVNPENIRFIYNKQLNIYEPYQEIKNSTDIGKQFIKLNTKTYKYCAIGGDTDLPYGIPPFLASLGKIKSQAGMDANIDFIIEQLGMLGFLMVNIDKPGKNAAESETAYIARLTAFLRKTKTRVKESLKDGIVVGYQDEHKFDFHSIGKNIGGLPEIYNQIQVQLASGLKHPPGFLGITSGKAESGTTIIFTKLLAQLNNIQKLIKEDLEFGIKMALLLSGYKFNHLSLNFNPTTITDKLKTEQAREIQIRNLTALYNQGIISQETFADEMGYESPDEDEPREVDVDPLGDQVKKEDREKDKDKSDRKVRDKNKPQPKRKDSSTKPV